MKVSEVVPVKYVGRKMLILDQSKLPGEEKYLEMETKEDIYVAIKKLKVRGAPAIGVAAAYGLYVSTRHSHAKTLKEFRPEVKEVADYIVKARPTAVNLSWALGRMMDRLDTFNGDVTDAKQLLLSEADKIRASEAGHGYSDPLQRRDIGNSQVRNQPCSYLPWHREKLRL
jgi:methylthioribose-1-phosphate isomerase